MLFLVAVPNRPIKLLLLIKHIHIKNILDIIIIIFFRCVVLCLAQYDVPLIEKMGVNTVYFHKKLFESILDNICMLVFSDKLHHVRVKRGEN